MIDREAYKKRAAEIKAKQGGGDFWKPKDAPFENRIRILPYVDRLQGKFFFEEAVKHFNLGPEGKSTVDCLDFLSQYMTTPIPCPVCAAIKVLEVGADEETKKLIYNIRAQSNYYIAILDRGDVATSEVIQTWTPSPGVVTKLLDFEADPGWDPGLEDAAKGKIITIVRHPKDAKNPFPKFDIRPAPADDPLSEDVLEKLMGVDLSKFIIPRSAEAIQILLDGGKLEDAEAEDKRVGVPQVNWISGAVAAEPVAEEAAEPAPVAKPAVTPKPVVTRPTTPVAKPAAPATAKVDPTQALKDRLKALAKKP